MLIAVASKKISTAGKHDLQYFAGEKANNEDVTNYEVAMNRVSRNRKCLSYQTHSVRKGLLPVLLNKLKNTTNKIEYI